MAKQEILLGVSFLIKAMALKAKVDWYLHDDTVGYFLVKEVVEEMEGLAETCREMNEDD